MGNGGKDERMEATSLGGLGNVKWQMEVVVSGAG